MPEYRLESSRGTLVVNCEPDLKDSAIELMGLYRDEAEPFPVRPGSLPQLSLMDWSDIHLVQHGDQYVASVYTPDGMGLTQDSAAVSKHLRNFSKLSRIIRRFGMEREPKAPYDFAGVYHTPDALAQEHLFLVRPTFNHIGNHTGWYAGPSPDAPPIRGTVNRFDYSWTAIQEIKRTRPSLLPILYLPYEWVVEVQGDEIINAWPLEPGEWEEYREPPKPRKKVGKKPAKDTEVPATAEELVQRLDAWLKEYRPGYHAALLPGLTDEELTSLEGTLGVALPEAFKAFYRWRNGQPPDSNENFQWNMMLMCSGQIVDAWKTMNDLKEGGDFDDDEWWQPSWVPFLDRGNGDHYCVDTDGSFGGAAGQVLEFIHDDGDRTAFHESFHKWMETCVKSLEQGFCTFEEGFGDEGDEAKRLDRLTVRLNPGYPVRNRAGDEVVDGTHDGSDNENDEGDAPPETRPGGVSGASLPQAGQGPSGRGCGGAALLLCFACWGLAVKVVVGLFA